MTLSNPTTSIAPSQRGVARPMANLGNTCYMNAVLQALAHSPELCNAIDCEPHSANCPIELENRQRYINSKQQTSSPSSSPDNGNSTDGSAEEDSWRQHLSRRIEKAPTRKSRRGAGKKSPPGADASGDNEFKFCALCEVEHHLGVVHSNKKNTGASSSSTRRGASKKDKPVSPTTFVHGFINHVAPWFKLGLQEDSHEFLRLLIDAMQKSCKEARSSSSTPFSSPRNNGSNDPASDCDNSHDSASVSSNPEAKERDRDVEYPFQLFRGTVESNVTCDSCKATSSTLDPIEDVGLEVTSSSSNLGNSSASSKNDTVLADVSSAFQRFTRVEELDVSYKCEKCGKVGGATKQSRLASIPPILTLHLKRFSYGANSSGTAAAPAGNGSRTSSRNNKSGSTSTTSRPTRRSSEVSQLLGNSGSFSDHYYTGKSGSAKIEGHIKFDMVIDLKPYVTAGLKNEHSSMLCRLFAVVVHAGKNSHSGHYITYVCSVKNKNEWWKMDDARVTMVSLQEVMSAEAYMLFYRVMDHPISMQLKKNKMEGENEASTAVPTPETSMKMQTTPAHHEEGASSTEKAVAATCKASAPDANQVLSAPDVLSTEAGNSADSSNSKRKRKGPEFETGEAWARHTTALKDFSVMAKAEKYISESVELSQAFYKIINEEASKPGAKVGNGPNTVICEDDIVGGYKKYYPVLHEFLCHVSTRFEEEKGEPFFLPDTTHKKPRFEKKMFEVVEASDDNLL